MQLVDFILERGQPLQVAAGKHVFHQGDTDPNLYYVREGALKAYYVRADGREHVKSLIGSGAIMGSIMAIEEGGTCTFNLIALSDAALIQVNIGHLREAVRNDVTLANDMIDFLAFFARRKERREYELLCLSAEERYRRFLADDELADASINQVDIAAYIGVTPQALSRIKKRVK